MKRVLLSAIAIISALQVSVAKDLDLTKPSSGEIYKMEVGGTPVDGVLECITITLPEYSRAIMFASPRVAFDAFNQLQPWHATDISTIFNSTTIENKPEKEVFFMALELPNGEYLTIQPISAEYVTSWIEVTGKNTIEIKCGTMGTGEIKRAETPIFAYTKSGNIYEALASMWGEILETDQVKGRTTWRDEKEYAELYKYLGWCSWEQYRKNINEPMLISAVGAIEKSDIPIRWVLIDDGHQNATGAALVDFTLSKEKFPNGWDSVLATRSEKVKWFGLWHCMFGLWGGISKQHTMDDLSEYMMTDMGKPVIVGDDERASKIFYDKLVNSVSEPGFDFTKIDVQTADFRNYFGSENPVVAHRQNAENLEAETKAKLDGLMNCMAQNLPCIFNTRYSATTRVSIDYKLNDIKKARSHIYQSFHNSIWMGQTIWPDHDMFHSSDVKLGRFMAVSKAMSAAPVYLSDAPEDFLPHLINPLVYEDGELLRPLAPGVPLPESLFANAFMGSDTYSVIAPMTPQSAAIVVYNISNEESTKRATVSESDYKYSDGMVQPYPGERAIPKEGLVYYDWYEQKGGVLSGEYSFDLPYVEDRIVLLTEVDNGWSVIGREDKYLSTIAVESYTASKKSITIELKEAGSLLVYSKKAIKSSTSGSVEALGNGIYRVNATSKSITLTR